MSPLTRLYLAFTRVSGPLWRLAHRRRLQRGKEDPARLPEKYGAGGGPRPEGEVLWFHALSVGESLALVPLIERALTERPHAHVVLTTSTASSVAALTKVGLPPRCLHRLLPIDTAAATRAFLDHWRPAVAVFAELDFWPRLLHETHGRRIPMVLVNARMSDKSLASRSRIPGMTRDVLRMFDALLLQDEGSRDRFVRLGADPDRVRVVGALKGAARPLPCEADELARLRSLIGDRPVWCAAATETAEEPAMIAAHKWLLDRLPDALVIAAPRFPDRADDYDLRARAAFARVARRSRGEALGTDTQFYLADTIGEMGLWYRLAPVSFVGHSLPGGNPTRGGKNPFEAAALGSAILHGPKVQDFAESYDKLTAAGACRAVTTPAEIGAAVLELQNEAERARMTDAARQVVEGEGAVLDTSWEAIRAALPGSDLGV